jgi:uncharacterized protein
MDFTLVTYLDADPADRGQTKGAPAQTNTYSIQATDALFEALDKGNTQMALRALKEGADPNGVRGDPANSPLMIAALHHQPAVSKELLERGANPNYARKGGDTALILCAFSNDRVTAKLIVDAGANIYKQNHANEDAMMRASRESKRELGQLIEQWAAERDMRLRQAKAEAELQRNIDDIVSTTRDGLHSPVVVQGPLRLKGIRHG